MSKTLDGGLSTQCPLGTAYSYVAFGQLTWISEDFGGTTTWTNPYRYDGRDGVRYDGETGLYWMSVRAYDSTLGRFLSRDPLGRVPLFFSDQPYVYAGNNPLINVDPSGQMADPGDGSSYPPNRWQYPRWGFPLSPNVDFPRNTRGWTHIPRSVMRTLAGRIVWAQNNIVGGGPGTRFLRGGKRWPWRTVGGAALWFNSFATKGIRYASSGTFISAGEGQHVEDQAMDWAVRTISTLVGQWGDKAWNAEFDVHLIATLPPCASWCSVNYVKGVWIRQLLAAAGGKLPGAIGGSTGIFIKLWVWVIVPNPNDPLGSSLLELWNGIKYGREPLAIWNGVPWQVLLN